MASYTSNYQLHQWVPGDNFLRTDFNEDFAKIDAAIKALEAATNTKLNQKAQVVTGAYTGTGTGTKTVSLGITARALWIASGTYDTLVTAGCSHPLLTFNGSSFTAQANSNYGRNSPNYAQNYVYVAIR